MLIFLDSGFRRNDDSRFDQRFFNEKQRTLRACQVSKAKNFRKPSVLAASSSFAYDGQPVLDLSKEEIMSETNAAPDGAEPSSEDVARILGNIVIPPCPRIVIAMVQEARSDDPDLLKLDKLISGDMGLASAVIKSANSPFYGLNNKVQAVKSALQVLGIRSVTSIVTLLALRNALGTPAQASDPFWDQFWDRTNYHAIACARLARQSRFISTDGAYTFGLFNDCGIPVLVQRFADYKETLHLAATSERPFVDLENERHGASHALVGSVLARSWQLPDLVCNAIRDHHRFDLLYGEIRADQGDTAALAAISLIADDLVSDFVGTSQDTAWQQHGAQALDYLGLDEDELQESKADILEELQEAQAYRR
jgi:HD-like signal output (HDOD) protein